MISLKHIISLKELDRNDLLAIIQKGIEIKHNPQAFFSACERKGLLMLFQKTSTRTSLSFQSAIHQMGGYAAMMDWEASNFKLSPIQYEVRYASRNCDLIMARLKNHDDLLQLAQYSSVPVINGCCEKYHPCQALTDLMTVYEVAGTLSGITLTYVGIHNNDMPIHPGMEIEEELIESDRSIIYQQAENRMHAQKALMLHLVENHE